jgi:hypothetical protein
MSGVDQQWLAAVRGVQYMLGGAVEEFEGSTAIIVSVLTTQPSETQWENIMRLKAGAVRLTCSKGLKPLATAGNDHHTHTCWEPCAFG